ncbi:TIGR03985 family CRISPR-associated protein [Oscillatoria salina]|uniref:TIGR03985 family CRISPR-associated protein n=1 Tax=Oscillatoria salina TaxID=331517 RepID=UPI0013B8AA02|nr:TIGR03985 family CRISPR-associated protein [Oscillatoria salina]MBZ8181452.1 TIGR03985 family CRISPR-associated protein [Oscillatoria salina IIICB1]NET88408.1 TIGR03985 family CRISPR-associated protein [Kamptonema sp. SIO1D9]
MSDRYLPTPQILQWLAAGQLANRLQRSVRLWKLVNLLYSEKTNWASKLPQTFTYPRLREILFASSHPTSDRLTAAEMTQRCWDHKCICHQSMSDLLFAHHSNLNTLQWQTEVISMTGLTSVELQQNLEEHPFATVHRTLRDDLKHLSQLGWLQIPNQGKYRCIPVEECPTPPLPLETKLQLDRLTTNQAWELLRVLESVSFIQPSLAIAIDSLWQQLTETIPKQRYQEPKQRIFIHLNYILTSEKQDQVDNYQQQLEELWHHPSGGVIQFETWVAKTETKITVTTYPVCLHYLSRAKYLSAYGQNPDGKIGWHNYRLDRFVSPQLKIIPWEDPQIPRPLQQLKNNHQLPTPEYIKHKLDEAWGFNFYLPCELLILRFPAKFARWYVENTFRHPTFKAIDYSNLGSLINREISDPQQCQEIIKIILQRDPNDAYYQAWIRTEDINVLMRLREWRPNGEVIAPISLRKTLAREANQELSNYQL